MTYTVAPQKWSEPWPYDDGYAIIAPDGAQVGWAMYERRARELVEERNEGEKAN